MVFFSFILTTLRVLLNVVSGYFLIIAGFAFIRPRQHAAAPPRTKFAALIPARNEEAVIAALIRSLREQNYPPELCDIFVVPNNCTDSTESASIAAGAEIIRCVSPVRCKGDAMREAVDALLRDKRGYDAICVFDADNIVCADFLTEMNSAFASGARVCKGRLMANNPYASATAGCYAVYFETFNLFFNRARASCGLSAKIVGTGFAVHRDVLEKLGGWNTRTIAEDAEFAAQLALSGERVTWVPGAITYDEEPESFLVSLSQRLRWCGGISAVARLMLPQIFTRGARRGNRRLTLDLLMILLTPFTQAATLVTALTGVFTALFTGTLTRFVLDALPALCMTYAAMSVFAGVMAALAGYWRGIARGVLLFPLFMATWLPIHLISLFRRKQVWREMKHRGGADKARDLAIPRVR